MASAHQPGTIPGLGLACLLEGPGLQCNRFCRVRTSHPLGHCPSPLGRAQGRGGLGKTPGLLPGDQLAVGQGCPEILPSPTPSPGLSTGHGREWEIRWAEPRHTGRGEAKCHQVPQMSLGP